MRLLEEHIGEHIHDLGVGKDFLNSSPKMLIINGKCIKLGNTKIKNFYNIFFLFMLQLYSIRHLSHTN